MGNILKTLQSKILCWLRGSCFSCKHYADQAFEELDHEAPVWRRPSFIFHHYWCFRCRRFRTQIFELENLVKDYLDAVEDNRIIQGYSFNRLPEDFSEQLSKEIELELERAEQ